MLERVAKLTTKAGKPQGRRMGTEEGKEREGRRKGREGKGGKGTGRKGRQRSGRPAIAAVLGVRGLPSPKLKPNCLFSNKAEPESNWTVSSVSSITTRPQKGVRNLYLSEGRL